MVQFYRKEKIDITLLNFKNVSNFLSFIFLIYLVILGLTPLFGNQMLFIIKNLKSIFKIEKNFQL